jgi:4-aminobutyrate aminotransferase/(S)-3-amino-2-methylpropionate transaminase
MEHVHVGGLGGTFGGNPLSCAAGLAILDTIQKEGLLAKAERVGEVLRARLDDLAERFPLIGDVRGRGAMQAIELVEDREAKTPAKHAASELIEACYREGVLILKAGTFDNVIRFLPPLTIEEGLLVEGLDVLEKAMAGINGR